MLMLRSLPPDRNTLFQQLHEAGTVFAGPEKLKENEPPQALAGTEIVTV